MYNYSNGLLPILDTASGMLTTNRAVHDYNTRQSHRLHVTPNTSRLCVSHKSVIVTSPGKTWYLPHHNVINANKSQEHARLTRERSWVRPLAIPPFCFAGSDCFGPFYVKRGRSQEKDMVVYLHVSLSESFTLRSSAHWIQMHFSMCWWDSVREELGLPEIIRSDNGTNLISGEIRETLQNWNESKNTQKHIFLHQIKWELNPPSASHMGEVWERQIRTVRKVLNAIKKDEVLRRRKVRHLILRAWVHCQQQAADTCIWWVQWQKNPSLQIIYCCYVEAP